MSARLIEFPKRRFLSVRVLHDAGAWLVLAGEHGWAHSDACSASADAAWLSKNMNLPVRCEAAS
jgi:hypothetical protein